MKEENLIILETGCRASIAYAAMYVLESINVPSWTLVTMMAVFATWMLLPFIVFMVEYRNNYNTSK